MTQKLIMSRYERALAHRSIEANISLTTPESRNLRLYTTLQRIPRNKRNTNKTGLPHSLLCLLIVRLRVGILTSSNWTKLQENINIFYLQCSSSLIRCYHYAKFVGSINNKHWHSILKQIVFFRQKQSIILIEIIANTDKVQNNLPKLIYVPCILVTLWNFPRTKSPELSPSFMVFGREIDLPFDLKLAPKDPLQQAAKKHFWNI